MFTVCAPCPRRARSLDGAVKNVCSVNRRSLLTAMGASQVHVGDKPSIADACTGAFGDIDSICSIGDDVKAAVAGVRGVPRFKFFFATSAKEIKVPLLPMGHPKSKWIRAEAVVPEPTVGPAVEFANDIYVLRSPLVYAPVVDIYGDAVVGVTADGGPTYLVRCRPETLEIGVLVLRSDDKSFVSSVLLDSEMGRIVVVYNRGREIEYVPWSSSDWTSGRRTSL